MKTTMQGIATALVAAMIAGCSGTAMNDYLAGRKLLEHGSLLLGMAAMVRPATGTMPGTDKKYGRLIGKVRDTSKRDVRGASVALYVADSGALVQYGNTNQVGVFSFASVPAGDLAYVIEVTAEGYLNAAKNNVSVIADDEIDIGIIYVVPANALPGTITGTVVDANDGQPLTGSGVEITDWTGQIVDTQRPATEKFTTGQMQPGTYTVRILLGGYFDLMIDNVTVNGNIDIDRLAICEVLFEPQVRVIVQWGKTPTDLDLHVVGPTLKTASDGLPANRFHVMWSNQKSHNENDGKYNAAADPRGTASTTSLVQDSRTSYGPEAINLFGVGSGYANGAYTFTVHQYSADGNWYDFPVTMRIFDSGGLVYELPVPSGAGTSRYWKAVKIDVRGRSPKERNIVIENSFANLDYNIKSTLDW